MDLRKIRLPEYFWKHYSGGNLYSICHIARKEGTAYITDWQLYFSGENKEVEVDNGTYHFASTDVKPLQSMSSLPVEARQMIVKGIFTELEVRS
jgi:hypothetical protein